jgi:tetratricopeptide (TPR) repeat protein
MTEPYACAASPGSNIRDAEPGGTARLGDKSAAPGDPRGVPSVPSPLLDAGRALASGEPLRALGLVGLLDSALGLMLRGIAYAQIGDLELAKQSLQRALSLADDPLTRARARAALVEIALSLGDPAPAARAAKESADELARLGDARNAAMQRLILARAEVLLGRLDEARRVVEEITATALPPDLRAVAWLAQAEIGIRAIATTAARDALSRARQALEEAPNHLLSRALVALEQELSRPVARLLRGGELRDADLFTVEDVSRGELLLVDACRRLAIGGRVTIPLARRPVVFALLLVLGRAWPASVPRDELAARAFDVRRVNPSHRARLRVELGRLRKLMDGLAAEPVATPDGYALSSKRAVAVLLPPSDDELARVALLLGDGASWSAQGLAEHAGISKRTAQRALGALVATGGAIRTGTGRDQRYTRPGTPIASRMLLLGLVPKT